MTGAALPPLPPSAPKDPSSPPALRPPGGLPELRAGAHLVPEDGACLMEYVSVLVGAPFTDRPRCTDPTLGALARLVNDSCTDAGRSRLATFAPLLAGSPAADARRTAAIVRAAVRAASVAAGGPAVRRHLRRAEHRYDRVTGVGIVAAVARHLDGLYRAGPGLLHLTVSVEAMRVLPEPQRDAALVAILAAAIAAAAQPVQPHHLPSSVSVERACEPAAR